MVFSNTRKKYYNNLKLFWALSCRLKIHHAVQTLTLWRNRPLWRTCWGGFSWRRRSEPARCSCVPAVASPGCSCRWCRSAPSPPQSSSSAADCKLEKKLNEMNSRLVKVNIQFFFLEMYPCLEVPPDPGEPFSPPAPSFALGLVCLSSLESLQNKQKLFPLGRQTFALALATISLRRGCVAFCSCWAFRNKT